MIDIARKAAEQISTQLGIEHDRWQDVDAIIQSAIEEDRKARSKVAGWTVRMGDEFPQSDDTRRLDWLEKNPENWLDIRDAFIGGNFWNKGVRKAIDSAMKEKI